MEEKNTFAHMAKLTRDFLACLLNNQNPKTTGL